MSIAQEWEQKKQEWIEEQKKVIRPLALASVRLMEQGRVQAGLLMVQLFTDPLDPEGIGEGLLGQVLRLTLFMEMLQQVRDHSASTTHEVQDLATLAPWMNEELANAYSLHQQQVLGQLGEHVHADWMLRVPSWPEVCAQLAGEDSRWMGAAFAASAHHASLKLRLPPVERVAIQKELVKLLHQPGPRGLVPSHFRKELGAWFVASSTPTMQREKEETAQKQQKQTAEDPEDVATTEAVEVPPQAWIIDPILASVSPEAFSKALQITLQQASDAALTVPQQVQVAQHALFALSQARVGLSQIMNIQQKNLFSEAHRVAQGSILGAIEQLSKADRVLFWEPSFWESPFLGQQSALPSARWRSHGKGHLDTESLTTPLQWLRLSVERGEDVASIDSPVFLPRWWMSQAPRQWTRVNTWDQLQTMVPRTSTLGHPIGSELVRAAIECDAVDWDALRQEVASHPLSISKLCGRACSIQGHTALSNRVWTSIGMRVLTGMQLPPKSTNTETTQDLLAFAWAIAQRASTEFETVWPVLERTLMLMGEQPAQHWPLPTVSELDEMQRQNTLTARGRVQVPLLRATLEVVELRRTLEGSSAPERSPRGLRL